MISGTGGPTNFAHKLFFVNILWPVYRIAFRKGTVFFPPVFVEEFHDIVTHFPGDHLDQMLLETYGTLVGD